MFLMEIVLLSKIGETTTGLFWFYLFPALAFFTFGNKKGIYFATSLLIVAIIYFNISPENLTFYPKDLHERFITEVHRLNLGLLQ